MKLALLNRDLIQWLDPAEKFYQQEKTVQEEVGNKILQTKHTTWVAGPSINHYYTIPRG